MGVENGFSPEIPQEEILNPDIDKESKKPFFSHRSVVKAKLDGTVPFEGAITSTTKAEDGSYMYKVVQFPDAPECEQGLSDIVSEKSLLSANQGELHLWEK